MSMIRRIRSVSGDDQDPTPQPQGTSGFGGGFGGASLSGNGFGSGHSMRSSGSWGRQASSSSAFGGPVISPPIQFHEIPIVNI